MAKRFASTLMGFAAACVFTTASVHADKPMTIRRNEPTSWQFLVAWAIHYTETSDDAWFRIETWLSHPKDEGTPLFHNAPPPNTPALTFTRDDARLALLPCRRVPNWVLQSFFVPADARWRVEMTTEKPTPP